MQRFNLKFRAFADIPSGRYSLSLNVGLRALPKRDYRFKRSKSASTIKNNEALCIYSYVGIIQQGSKQVCRNQQRTVVVSTEASADGGQTDLETEPRNTTGRTTQHSTLPPFWDRLIQITLD